MNQFTHNNFSNNQCSYTLDLNVIKAYLLEASKHPILSSEQEKEYTLEIYNTRIKIYNLLTKTTFLIENILNACKELIDSNNIKNNKWFVSDLYYDSNNIQQIYQNIFTNYEEFTKTEHIIRKYRIWINIINTIKLLPIDITHIDNIIKPIMSNKTLHQHIILINNNSKKKFLYDLKNAYQNFIYYRDKLITSNLRLVIACSKYYWQYADANDLIQEGNIGLMKAVQKFDPNKGFKFSTYAVWWIKQYIKRYISNNIRMIRLPVHISDALYKIQKVIEEYKMSNNGAMPTIQYISDKTNITKEHIEKYMNYNTNLQSLDEIVFMNYENNDTELYDLIASNQFDNPEELVFKEMQKDYILSAINKLNDREKYIVLYKYGFIDGKEYSLSDLSKILNISRERVRQIEKKALKKMTNDLYNIK